MDSVLLHFVSSHSAFFVLGAACICAITAWLILTLLERARAFTGRLRLQWMAGVALVGGLGVWTTHFIAMLGFRPDFLFGYDPMITAASALIGVGLIGLPLSAIALTDRRLIHAACGTIAGAGVAAMHFTGMWALEGCVVTHSAVTSTLSTAFGIGVFAAAFSLPDRLHSKALAAVLIVVAVCTVHFMAMAGLSLGPVTANVGAGVDQVTLGGIVAAITSQK